VFISKIHHTIKYFASFYDDFNSIAKKINNVLDVYNMK